MKKRRKEKIIFKELAQYKKDYKILCNEIFQNHLKFSKVQYIEASDPEARKKKNLKLRIIQEKLFCKKRKLLLKINDAKEISTSL